MRLHCYECLDNKSENEVCQKKPSSFVEYSFHAQIFFEKIYVFNEPQIPTLLKENIIIKKT